jgi:DNA-binding beta-propeller fold protein YncE
MSYVAGSQLAVGTTVSGYRVEALIGRGGMGAVYRAADERLGRKVALKVIAPELAQDERFRERFLRESRIAASLDHPHVIPIYQAGEEQGLLFLAMRYVEGTDLARLVAEEGALDPRRALDILSQIAEALDVAHEKGLVHRDVKPSNVLIAYAAGKEHCYLADFGLTKRTGSLSGVSVAGDIVGTLEYVAPEQITGEPLDERSDVYSLGCVLYECLTGQSPFPRATDVALLWAHVHEEPTPPSTLRPELPRELDAVLTRALAKEPGRRYRSAGELVAATRSALRLGEAAPAPAAKRTRTLLGGVAAGLLIAAAIAAGLLLTRDSGGISGVSANAVGIIDPGSNRLVGEAAVGTDPEAIAVGAGAVWVANVGEESISRVDPAQPAATAPRIPVGGYPSDVTVDGGSVWVALGALAELARINPETGTAATPIPALGEGATCSGGPRASVVFGAGFLWFVCEQPELGRVDPNSSQGQRIGLDCGLVTSSASVLGVYSDAAFGLDALWIVDRASNVVLEVDPLVCENHRPIQVGVAPTAAAVGEGALWVTNYEDDTVWRVSIAGRGQPASTTSFEVGDGPMDVAVGEGGVWVVNQLDRTVMRIDPASGDIEATIRIGNEPQRVAAGSGRVWVTVRAAEDALEEDGAGP